MSVHSERREIEGSEPVVMPTPWGEFEVRAWRGNDGEHLTLSAASPAGDRANGVALQARAGQPSLNEPVLVRIHSECATGDIFGSHRCDCGEQLDAALTMIAREGGVLVYMRGHEGRGIGLFNKIRAYHEQDMGADTVDANVALGLPVDDRHYGDAASILRALGVGGVRLISNNPAKDEALAALGIDVLELVPSIVGTHAANARYLATKRDRMAHRLPSALT